MRGFAAVMGTDDFPIHHIGSDAARDMKLSRIANRDRALLENISVCWEDTTIGGNCGKCDKCVRTRLALYAAGLPQNAFFDDEIDLADAIRRTPISEDAHSRLLQIRLSYYSFHRMRDGEVRTALYDRMREIADVDGYYVGPMI